MGWETRKRRRGHGRPNFCRISSLQNSVQKHLIECVFCSTLPARAFMPVCVISGMYQGKSDLGGLSYVSAYQLSSRSAQISIEWHLAHLAHLGSGEQRKVLRSLRVKTSWEMLARSWATPVREINRQETGAKSQVPTPYHAYQELYQAPESLPVRAQSQGVADLRSCISLL